ncbi:MAG: MIP/aquaporin family protein [Verrucomicrobiaceae bacterium]
MQPCPFPGVPIACAEIQPTTAMSATLAELLGTMILILLGDGVVANVVLKQTKGNNAGWIVITAGWAFAVTIGVYCTNAISGAHLNPAVTIGLATIGKFEWALVPGYIAAQMAGAFLGGVLVWLAYLPHWKATDDQGAKLAVFCTGPAIRHTTSNLICEIIGTAVLVLGVLAILSPANLVPNSGFDKGLAPALVGVLVWSIGLSLGGPTGYAINPARDLGPRLAHFVLPIPGKGGPDWGYAWIPVAGPIIGGIVGAMMYKALWPVV